MIQQALRHARLTREDIKAGAEQTILVKGGDQGVFVHHPAARDVDQDAVKC